MHGKASNTGGNSQVVLESGFVVAVVGRIARNEKGDTVLREGLGERFVVTGLKIVIPTSVDSLYNIVNV